MSKYFDFFLFLVSKIYCMIMEKPFLPSDLLFYFVMVLISRKLDSVIDFIGNKHQQKSHINIIFLICISLFTWNKIKKSGSFT